MLLLLPEHASIVINDNFLCLFSKIKTQRSSQDFPFIYLVLKDEVNCCGFAAASCADNVYGMSNESGDEERKEVVGTSSDVATQSSSSSQGFSGNAYGAPATLNGSTTVAKQVAPPVSVDYLSWRLAYCTCI